MQWSSTVYKLKTHILVDLDVVEEFINLNINESSIINVNIAIYVSSYSYGSRENSTRCK